MNKKNKILQSAKKAFSRELASIKTLSSTFNNNFYKAVETIHSLKGRVILTEGNINSWKIYFKGFEEIYNEKISKDYLNLTLLLLLLLPS